MRTTILAEIEVKAKSNHKARLQIESLKANGPSKSSRMTKRAQEARKAYDQTVRSMEEKIEDVNFSYVVDKIRPECK